MDMKEREEARVAPQLLGMMIEDKVMSIETAISWAVKRCESYLARNKKYYCGPDSELLAILDFFRGPGGISHIVNSFLVELFWGLPFIDPYDARREDCSLAFPVSRARILEIVSQCWVPGPIHQELHFIMDFFRDVYKTGGDRRVATGECCDKYDRVYGHIYSKMQAMVLDTMDARLKVILADRDFVKERLRDLEYQIIRRDLPPQFIALFKRHHDAATTTDQFVERIRAKHS